MSDKNLSESKDNNLEKDEEKILYGLKDLTCFACGEKINGNTDICPYCNTPIK